MGLKRDMMELTIISAVVVLLSLGGVVWTFVSGLIFSGLDGIMLLFICLMMGGIFTLELFLTLRKTQLSSSKAAAVPAAAAVSAAAPAHPARAVSAIPPTPAAKVTTAPPAPKPVALASPAAAPAPSSAAPAAPSAPKPAAAPASEPEPPK
jgi:predicted lipid-binding transport protein (Tim44 family)